MCLARATNRHPHPHINHAHTGRNRFDLLVVLTRAAFHRIAVATPISTRLEAVQCRGIIATCRAEPGDGPPSVPPPPGSAEGGAAAAAGSFDFLSRFFAPRCGISEDPGKAGENENNGNGGKVSLCVITQPSSSH